MLPWVRILASLLAAVVLGGCYAPEVNLQRTYHPSDADLTATRIIHGSLVLDFRETRLLVDPWYSPSPPLGPRATIGIALEKLPSMRGILITDDRRVHFDPDTLRRFAPGGPRVVVPPGLGPRTRELGFVDVVTAETWEQVQVGGVLVTAVPSEQRQPATGYVLQANGVTAYVAGDTRFDAVKISAVAQRFPDVDVALLPIGGTRVAGRRLHMTPEEAVRAFGILRPSRVIPYHYELVGPIPFVLVRPYALEEFRLALKERFPDLDPATMVALAPGESWHFYR